MNTAELSRVCRQVRRDIINMTANAGSGHPGGSLSAVELMVSTFYNHMCVDPKNPKAEDRDRFVLSKGHAAPCYYAVLAELGFISRDEFKNFRQLHSILQGHPDCKKVPGVDASTGSLGQGCSIAVGMALGAKLQGKDTKVFTLLGDGECQEGQIWEALMSAAHYKLDNLTVMVDRPAPIFIMLASAMPQSKKRSGCAALKNLVMVAPARSASSTTTFLFCSPSSTRALP